MAESTSGILIPVRLRSKNDTTQYPRELTELDGKLYFGGEILNPATVIKNSTGTTIGSGPEITMPDATDSVLGLVKLSSTTPKSSTSSGSAGIATTAARADHTHPAQTTVANADKATSDAEGQTIASTYIKSLSISGKVITITKGDNTTSTITTQDTTYPVATQTDNGLMSSTDKIKIDGIESGAQANVIESITSSNLSISTITDKSMSINLEWGEF